MLTSWKVGIRRLWSRVREESESVVYQQHREWTDMRCPESDRQDQPKRVQRRDQLDQAKPKGRLASTGRLAREAQNMETSETWDWMREPAGIWRAQLGRNRRGADFGVHAYPHNDLMRVAMVVPLNDSTPLELEYKVINRCCRLIVDDGE